MHMYILEYLYYGHSRDPMKCPDYRGVLISKVLYVAGTTGSVLIREAYLIRRSLVERFHYMYTMCVICICVAVHILTCTY